MSLTRAELIEALLLDPDMPDFMPFGKYEGESMRVVLADLSYIRWLIEQDDIVERHPWLEDCKPLVEGIVWR
jgi:hypothetical protein